MDAVFDETASGVVRVGDSFSGQFVFESTTPGQEPGDPDLGWYLHPNPLVLDLVLADYTVEHVFRIEGLRPLGGGAYLSVFSYTGTIEALTRVPEPRGAMLALAGAGAAVCLRGRMAKRDHRLAPPPGAS